MNRDIRTRRGHAALAQELLNSTGPTNNQPLVYLELSYDQAGCVATALSLLLEARELSTAEREEVISLAAFLRDVIAPTNHPADKRETQAQVA
jgi:hypothetical protein